MDPVLIMCSTWQQYVFDVEAIQSHPYYSLLQNNAISTITTFFGAQRNTFLECLFTFLVTVICVWAKAIALFGIIYLFYKLFFEPTKEIGLDLEAGSNSDESFQEWRSEKEKSVKAWDRFEIIQR